MCLCLCWPVHLHVSVFLSDGESGAGMDVCVLGMTGSTHMLLDQAVFLLLCPGASGHRYTSVGKPICAHVLAPMPLCGSMQPCRFSVCLVLMTSFSERVQLVDTRGGNCTDSCLARRFCLDKPSCCDRTCPQQTWVKVLGCHYLLPKGSAVTKSIFYMLYPLGG